MHLFVLLSFKALACSGIKEEGRPIYHIYLQQYALTHSHSVPLESVVCYSHTYKNNLAIKRKFEIYLNESCCSSSDKHFSFKCFPKKCFVSKNISKIVRLVLGSSECKLWINPIMLPLYIIICICDTFDDNLRIKDYFTKYLNESCWICSESHFSIQ